MGYLAWHRPGFVLASRKQWQSKEKDEIKSEDALILPPPSLHSQRNPRSCVSQTGVMLTQWALCRIPMYAYKIPLGFMSHISNDNLMS